MLFAVKILQFVLRFLAQLPEQMFRDCVKRLFQPERQLNRMFQLIGLKHPIVHHVRARLVE